MDDRAAGAFDVKLVPQAADGHADGVTLGRMTIDKQFLVSPAR